MEAPAPTYEIEYGHDRRKHRHRCASCNRIINAGDRVLMVKLQRGSRAAHIECADKTHSGQWTVRDAFTAWGLAYQRLCGWKVPQHPMECAP